MQFLSTCPRRRAFTLVELLVVAAVIGILMSLLLPTLARARSSAGRANCTSNLRMIVIALSSWAHDSADKYPWMVSSENGGTLDSNSAYDHFLALTNELATARVLACPADRLVKAKSSWADFETNGSTSLSYFAGICASPKNPRAILIGDRNITNFSDMTECVNAPGLYASGVSTNSSWDRDNHGYAGHLTFVDGSVSFVKTPQLRAATATGNMTYCGNNHVLVPCPRCVVTFP